MSFRIFKGKFKSSVRMKIAELGDLPGKKET
jgi:hypothetical protein